MTGRGSQIAMIHAVVMAGAIAALAALYDHQGRNYLLANEARGNVRVALALATLVWPSHGSELVALRTAGNDALRAHPLQQGLGTAVRAVLAGQPDVLEVSVRDDNGRTLFSTNPDAIGRMLGSAPGFHAAMARGQSNGFGTRLSPRHDPRADWEAALDVVYSQVRYRPAAVASDPAPPDFVIELASDVTRELGEHRNRLHAGITAGVLVALLALAMLYAIGRTADRRIAAAERARRAHAEAARNEAVRDGLTVLPNRQALNQLLADPARLPASQAAIFFIDLDRFKLLNDNLGQVAGDRILIETARRIATVLSDGVRLHRVNADQFVAVAFDTDPADSQWLARQVVESIRRPVRLDDDEVALSASVGLARWPADHPDLDQALRCADLAMLAAKRAGANRVTAFQPIMRTAVDEQFALANGLRRAFEQHQFVLHYQPRLNGRTLRIECVEALLRWQHPEAGLLPPARFIEALEESPLIIDVGRWVMKTACDQAVRWHREGLADLRVSVNVAARQFDHDGFVSTVATVLEQSGLPAGMLELELTESQLISHADTSQHRIRELKALGVKLAIDDFGTGYSALAYLQRLPIDCLKIDRSFVREVRDAEDGQIAQAIAALAHGLGLSVVAEGVETAIQEQAARLWGCEQLQGFRYSPPVTPAEIPSLIRRQAITADATEASIGASLAPSGIRPVVEASTVD